MKIELPWYDSCLSPNSREHWSKKIGSKNKLKDAGWVLALEQGKPERQDTYHLKIVFHPPDKKHRDLDNCLASIKAALDGIALAWEVNDKQFRPITIDFGDVVNNGSIVIKLDSST